jgi:hypothetical protein
VGHPGLHHTLSFILSIYIKSSHSALDQPFRKATSIRLSGFFGIHAVGGANSSPLCWCLWACPFPMHKTYGAEVFGSLSGTNNLPLHLLLAFYSCLISGIIRTNHDLPSLQQSSPKMTSRTRASKVFLSESALVCYLQSYWLYRCHTYPYVSDAFCCVPFHEQTWHNSSSEESIIAKWPLAHLHPDLCLTRLHNLLFVSDIVCHFRNIQCTTAPFLHIFQMKNLLDHNVIVLVMTIVWNQDEDNVNLSSNHWKLQFVPLLSFNRDLPKNEWQCFLRRKVYFRKSFRGEAKWECSCVRWKWAFPNVIILLNWN